MSDSANTNELESYGVWVKKPPRTVDSSGGEQTAEEEFNFGAELPDIDDSVITSEEKAAEPSSGEEEIDLSEFGFDDSGDASSSTEETSSSGGEEEIDLSEFGFDDSSSDESDSSDDFASSPAESTEITETETAPLAEDGPLDIDLSFDDSMPEPQKASTSSSGGGDEIDLSEFGFDDSPAPSDDGTESVDLSEFGFDDATSEPAIPGTLPEKDEGEESSEKAASAGGTTEEEIDLSEFGFDDSPAADNESGKDDSKDSDIEMKVVVDDDFDMDDDSESDESDDSASASSDTKSYSGDEGFDVDSILNSVEDENGQTISIGDAQGSASEDAEKALPEEKSKEADSKETNEDTIVINDIPDTFDEETSSLFDDEPAKETAPGEAAESKEAESQSKEIKNEKEAAPAPAQAATAVSNDILSQLMTVITSLKDEVASLKNDFEELKKHPVQQPAEDEIGGDITGESEPEEKSSSGFFSDTDDDDTIALSMDELMHIENTAEFAEEQGVSEKAPGTEDEEGPDFGDIPSDNNIPENIPEDIPENTVEDTSSEDEEDATLSLDELNNIQNTAAFTEEEGIPDSPESETEADSATRDISFDEPQIEEPSIEEPSTEESPIEEPQIDEPVVSEEESEPEIEEPIFDDIPADTSAEDEEDATLSLDELNNIQNTAAFTEEEGIPDSPESEIEESEIDSATRDISFDEPQIEEPSIDEPSTEESPIEEPQIDEPVVNEEESEIEEPIFGDIPSDDIPADTSSEDEEDATLSLDELNNIQNTAAFTEEEGIPDSPESDYDVEAETDSVPASDEAAKEESFEEPMIGEEELDFSNENLVEPSLDDINIDDVQEEEESDLPDEIEVPKVDDIFVESSSTDLMEEEQVDEQVANNEFVEPEVAPEEIIEDSVEADDNLPEDIELEEPKVPVSDTIFEEPEIDAGVSDEEIQQNQEEIIDEAPVTKSELNRLLAPNIEEEELTEGNLSYLESDAALNNIDEENQKEESSIPADLTKEIKAVLSYMDQLLENLPEDKIAEFAQSEQFETYKKLFTELGLD